MTVEWLGVVPATLHDYVFANSEHHFKVFFDPRYKVTLPFAEAKVSNICLRLKVWSET